jgi:hypothetical protein
MYQVLTEEEAINSSKGDMKLSDEWWSTLSIYEKKSIYKYHKDIFKQAKCTHEFHTQNFYSKKIECCDKCGYSRSIEEGRDEKITDIVKDSFEEEKK